MLKMEKRLLSLLALAVAVFIAVSPAPALAAAASAATQNGLTVRLESPQTVYQEGEYIPLSLSVENGNDYSLTGITAQITLTGLSLKYGPLEREMQIPAGGESALQPVAVKNAMPQTGDQQEPTLWTGLVLLSAGGLLFLGLRRKKAARLLSLLLCAALACAGQPAAAQAGSRRAEISVSLTLTVNNTQAVARGTVTYPLQTEFNVVGGIIAETGKTSGNFSVGTVVNIVADSSQVVGWSATGVSNPTPGWSDDQQPTLRICANGEKTDIQALSGTRNYSVTVQQLNGNLSSFNASVGTTVKITADAVENMVFDKWINTTETGFTTVHFADSAAQETTFKMPAGNVYAIAEGHNLHLLTVNGGTGGGWFKKDASIMINAGGLLHSGWHWAAVGANISPVDSVKDYFVFNMPANDVTITMTP